MGSKKFEKGSAEWNMMSDLWTLMQKFWVPEENDGYFNGISGAAEDFYKKHKGVDDYLVKKMAVNFIESRNKLLNGGMNTERTDRHV